MVTANSILSPAQSAGSACASEVEAVPSGATVGQTGTGEGGGWWGVGREFSHATAREEFLQGMRVGKNASHCRASANSFIKKKIFEKP